MKKIGLLAYHSACNFGANLQVYSTVGYLKKYGYQPLVINWIASDLEKIYHIQIPEAQVNVHREFINNYLPLTRLCRTSVDIANVIKEEQIDAVIIGSDAVAQHHPFLSRIFFPSRHILSVAHYTSDRMFPNPFWGIFVELLDKKVPLVYLSASSQNSDYRYIHGRLKQQMREALQHYSYISVRDSWTQRMFSYLTGKDKYLFPVTPDPVFAFNHNLFTSIPSKKEILIKYALPEKYLLVSFVNSFVVKQSWLNRFKAVAEKDGYTCVAFPFPTGITFRHPFDKEIPLPLPPLDWYALIKYASGYVGQNMHPIVVSLHNSVPFFSFDNYGITHFKCFVNRKSSKIYHVLEQAGFLENHFSALNYWVSRPTPQCVLDKIIHFNKEKCALFADCYYKKYQTMMDDIKKII